MAFQVDHFFHVSQTSIDATNPLNFRKSVLLAQNICKNNWKMSFIDPLFELCLIRISISMRISIINGLNEMFYSIFVSFSRLFAAKRQMSRWNLFFIEILDSDEQPDLTMKLRNHSRCVHAMAASWAHSVCVCVSRLQNQWVDSNRNGNSHSKGIQSRPIFRNFLWKKNASEKRCKQSTWKSAICNEKSSYRLAASASNYLRYEFSYRYRHSDTVSIVSETMTEREREHRLRKTQPKHTEYQKQSFLQPRQQTPKCKRARPEMSAFNRTIHDYYYAVCIDVLPSLTGLKNMKM